MSGKVRYIKVARIDGNGTDITNTLESLTNIVLPLTGGNRTYQILNRTRFNDYYLYYVNPPDLVDIPGADKSTPEYNFTGSLSGSVVSFGTGTKKVTIVPTVSSEGTNSNFYNPNNNRVEFNTFPQKDIHIKAIFTASIESRNGSVELYHANSTLTNITLLTTPVTLLIGTRTGVREASIPEANISPGDVFFLGVTNQANNSPYITASFSDTTLNITSSVATGTEKEVIVEPYLTMKFRDSDCDVLQGEAKSLRANPFLQDLDYSTSQTVPVNIQAIISESATKGTVPESNYTQLANANPRYYGSKNQTQKLNEWTQFKGNIGTYGKTSAVDSETSLIVYCDWIGGNKPDRNDTVSAHIQYIIKEDGTIEEPNLKPESIGNIQHAFESRKNAIINLTDPPAAGGMEVLNGIKNIVRGGSRIESIIHTQSGSLPNVHFVNSMSFQATDEEGAPEDVRASFTYTGPQTITDGVATKVEYDGSIYGNPFLTNNSYQANVDVVGGNISLSFNPQLVFKTTNAQAVYPATQNPNTNISFLLNVVRKRGTNLKYYPFTPDLTQQSVSNPLLFEMDSYGVLSDTINTGFIIGGNATTYTSVLGFPFPNSRGIITPVTIPAGDIQVNDEFYIEITIYKNPTLGITLENSAEFYTSEDFTELQNFSTSVIIDQDPAFATPVTSPFWEYSGSGLTHITSSVDLGKSYGLYKQTDIENSGFSKLSLPFTLQTGDEFRFEGSENYAYSVKSVVEPQNNDAIIKVEFYESLPSGSGFDLNNFSVRRYVEDGSFIIFEAEKPAGNSGPSIIKPEFTTVNLERDINEIIVDLTDRGLIE